MLRSCAMFLFPVLEGERSSQLDRLSSRAVVRSVCKAKIIKSPITWMNSSRVIAYHGLVEGCNLSELNPLQSLTMRRI